MTAHRTKEQSAALKDAIVERYTTSDAGMNAIAEALGCDRKFVRRVLLDSDIPLVAKPRPTPRNRIAKVIRNQEIVDSFERGISLSEIARRFGLSPDQVTNILVSAGKQPRLPQINPRSSDESAALKAAIIDQFLHTDIPLTRIAADLSCHRQYVVSVLRGRDRPPHRVRPKPKPQRPNKVLRNQQIAVLYDSGMRTADIGKRFGLTHSNVSSIARRMGCAPRIPRCSPEAIEHRNQQVLTAHLHGERIPDIAQRFGLSASYVKDLLVKLRKQHAQ